MNTISKQIPHISRMHYGHTLQPRSLTVSHSGRECVLMHFGVSVATVWDSSFASTHNTMMTIIKPLQSSWEGTMVSVSVGIKM